MHMVLGAYDLAHAYCAVPIVHVPCIVYLPSKCVCVLWMLQMPYMDIMGRVFFSDFEKSVKTPHKNVRKIFGDRWKCELNVFISTYGIRKGPVYLWHIIKSKSSHWRTDGTCVVWFECAEGGGGELARTPVLRVHICFSLSYAVHDLLFYIFYARWTKCHTIILSLRATYTQNYER